MTTTIARVLFGVGATLGVATLHAQTTPPAPTDERGQAGKSTDPAYPANPQDRTSSASSQGHEGMQNSATEKARHDDMTDTSATRDARLSNRSSTGAANRPTFETLDKNHDGNLSTEEISGGRLAADCDKDGDHRVSRDEYSNCSK